MFERLEKYRTELSKLKAKQSEIDEKIKDLERKCAEEEKTQVHDLVKAANMTPEQLARVIAYAKNHTPNLPMEQIVNKEEEDHE